jgi:1-acyl-sn-glycerol-3-phosphate acyltransferase
VKSSNPDRKYAPPAVIDAARYISLAVSKVLWSIEYHGRENIPPEEAGGLLIVANHQTYIDPFWICAPMKRKFRFMAWDKAFEWPVVGPVMRYLGSFPVDTKRGTTGVMRTALTTLRDGAALLVFPEAEREFSDGRMLEFKPGAARIALEAGVPVLPVTVRGGNRVWAQDMKYPRPGKIDIFYHPPFCVAKPPKDADLRPHLECSTKQIAEIIASKL